MYSQQKESRYHGLDGWRGVSILLVMAGHLFPLGPKHWQLNFSVATSGMAIFFILSGFLITRILLSNQDIKQFLIRRFARIVPLAWLVLCILLVFNQSTVSAWFGNLLFYANLPPITLMQHNGHFWSLCVEMQFYLFIAALVLLFKKKGLLLLPIICLLLTLLRIANGIEISIVTLYRVDEILAGCCLALIFSNDVAKPIQQFIGSINPIPLFMLLILSAHPSFESLNYARPYIAMLLVGSTLFNSQPSLVNQWLNNHWLIYIAQISYALYIIHGVLGATWIGTGGTIEKYAKRPFLLLFTWMLAHVSTFYYERYWIQLSKKITSNKPQIFTRTRTVRNL